MSLYEDIEKDYVKRKKEAEDRANQILYGKSPEPEIHQETHQVQDNPDEDTVTFCLKMKIES